MSTHKYMLIDFWKSSLGGCMLEILSHLCPINFCNWSSRQFPEMWGMCAFRLFFLKHLARKPARGVSHTTLPDVGAYAIGGRSKASSNVCYLVGKLLVSKEWRPYCFSKLFVIIQVWAVGKLCINWNPLTKGRNINMIYTEIILSFGRGFQNLLTWRLQLIASTD